MQQTRRQLIFSGGSLAVLSACGSVPAEPAEIETPATLSISALGSAGMNPGPDGGDRPLVLQVVQMSGVAAFDSADFFTLQDPETALGSEFVSLTQIVLEAGVPAAATIQIEDVTTTVGIIAGFRDPAGKIFRVKTGAPEGRTSLSVSVGSAGLSLQSV